MDEEKRDTPSITLAMPEMQAITVLLCPACKDKFEAQVRSLRDRYERNRLERAREEAYHQQEEELRRREWQAGD